VLSRGFDVEVVVRGDEGEKVCPEDGKPIRWRYRPAIHRRVIR